MDLELLKYPIGKYAPTKPITDEQVQKWIPVIQAFPEKIHQEVKDLTDKEIPPGGMVCSAGHPSLC